MEKGKLIRFLNGECTTEEEQEILLWAERPGARKELDLLIEKNWEKESPSISDQTDYVKLLNQIHSRFKGKRKERIFWWNDRIKQSLKLAASLTMLVFCVYFLLEGFKFKANNPSYGQTERVVQLKGEAYFEIVSVSFRPFSVQINGLTTTALGTRFNVFARAHHYKIALAEGAVKIGAVDRELKLVPGQLAVWKPTSSDAEFSVGAFDIEEIFGWKEGMLNYNRKPLKIILKELAAFLPNTQR